jgi:hypothetical protein
MFINYNNVRTPAGMQVSSDGFYFPTMNNRHKPSESGLVQQMKTVSNHNINIKLILYDSL